MIPIRYNFRSIARRRMAALMTIVGVALTVAVFVSVLALVEGLRSTFTQTGDPMNLILIRQGSQSETQSTFDKEIKRIVETMDGVDAVAGEMVTIFVHPRVTGDTTNVVLRGISDKSLALRPALRIAEGRMLRTGLREVVVSRSISHRFKDARLGDSIQIGRVKWSVVGIIDAAHTAYDSEIWGDYSEVAQEFDRTTYSSLLVRAKDAATLPLIKERIAGDRRVKLDVFGEKQYFETQTSTALPVQILGYLIGIIMAVGSCFAVMNTMYAATAYRTREIATLRVLGFKRRNILFSFVCESLVLAVCGGIVGCMLAAPVHGISTGTANMSSFAEVTFQFRITPQLIGEGLLFAAIMGGIGGLLPARQAARMPIVRALRTEA